METKVKVDASDFEKFGLVENVVFRYMISEIEKIKAEEMVANGTGEKKTRYVELPVKYFAGLFHASPADAKDMVCKALGNIGDIKVSYPSSDSKELWLQAYFIGEIVDYPLNKSEEKVIEAGISNNVYRNIDEIFSSYLLNSNINGKYCLMYKGISYKTKLQKQWAMILDGLGAKWEHNKEMVMAKCGAIYVPDFKILDLAERGGPVLYMSVVEEKITPEKALDIKLCAERTPMLFVGEIPEVEKFSDLEDYMFDEHKNSDYPYLYNFHTIDGDCYPLIPCKNRQGKMVLLGDQYLDEADMEATVEAYRKALNAM